MINKDFTDSERILMLEQFREDFTKRIDSYHNDVKKIDEKLDKTLEKRDEALTDKIRLMFIDESRKLSDGMTLKIKENNDACIGRDEVQNSRITILENSKIKQTGFIAGASFIFSFFGAGLVWVLNKIF